MADILVSDMSATIGVSGYEKKIREQLKRTLSGCSAIQIREDKTGNLICFKKGTVSGITMMIVAHMDEVGFQVMSVDKEGYASLKVLGNIKTWNTLNQKVATSDGKKRGIIYCEDLDGIKAHDLSSIKVIPVMGDFVVGDVLGFDAQLIESEKLMIGKALDNRVSCAILCELLKLDISVKHDTYFAFTTQEETGMRGARVAITSLMPDIIIDVDVSPVGERNSLKLGDGVGIKLSDSVGISSEELVEQVERYAIVNEIKHQREVSDCGTAELIITNEKDAGSKRIGISIPCRNMHSPATVVDKRDVLACKQLLEVIMTNGLSPFA